MSSPETGKGAIQTNPCFSQRSAAFIADIREARQLGLLVTQETIETWAVLHGVPSMLLESENTPEGRAAVEARAVARAAWIEAKAAELVKAKAAASAACKRRHAADELVRAKASAAKAEALAVKEVKRAEKREAKEKIVEAKADARRLAVLACNARRAAR